jgi:hypothetical protein
MAPATALILDSTEADLARCPLLVRLLGLSGRGLISADFPFERLSAAAFLYSLDSKPT